MTFLYAQDKRGGGLGEQDGRVCMEEKHEPRWNRDRQSSLVWLNAHAWPYPCTCKHLWHANLLRTGFDHLPFLHAPQLLPYTWPHPAHLCRASRKKKGMRREGTVFRPCGGQSLQISQANLGPSPPGACAQQALLSPPSGLRSLKWAPRLQTAETCLCPLATGGHWWLTPSLCLWTRHARDGELHLRRPSQIQQKTATLCQKCNCCQKCFFFLFYLCLEVPTLN